VHVQSVVYLHYYLSQSKIENIIKLRITLQNHTIRFSSLLFCFENGEEEMPTGREGEAKATKAPRNRSAFAVYPKDN
jgi:hypothetical protein